MSIGGAIALVLAALAIFWCIGAYNRLMELRNRIGAAFGQMDTALRQRAEQVQRLLEILRFDLPSEQITLDTLQAAQVESVAAAEAMRPRPTALDSIGKLVSAEAAQGAVMARLSALLDQHIELRERSDVQPLLMELKSIERQRSFARDCFNEAVRIYNAAAHQFPTRLLVGMYGFDVAGKL